MPWVTNLIHVLGWSFIIGLVWKSSGKFSSFLSKIDNTHTTVNLVATNHLPHIQAELEKSNEINERGFSQMSTAISNLQTSLTIIATK